MARPAYGAGRADPWKFTGHPAAAKPESRRDALVQERRRREVAGLIALVLRIPGLFPSLTRSALGAHGDCIRIVATMFGGNAAVAEGDIMPANRVTSRRWPHWIG